MLCRSLQERYHRQLLSPVLELDIKFSAEQRTKVGRQQTCAVQEKDTFGFDASILTESFLFFDS
jgi:hypothetical protein